MLRDLVTCCVSAIKFRDYRPQKVTFAAIRRWLRQFDPEDRGNAARLLKHVIYISEAKATQLLVEQNDLLLRRLRESGIPPKKVVYVQVHDAGSSSPAMLNLLRDAGGLERLGCQFVDSRDALGINTLTNRLGSGALVYVDDFAGTADQFCKSRDFAIKYVVGSFSEFFLAPSMCEEAVLKLGQLGVEPVAAYIHPRAERPLHAQSAILNSSDRQRLRDLCQGIRPNMPLGYKDVASMVVLYRNAPTSIPVIFRGSLNQTPFAGLFPRTTDLPKRQI